MFLYARCIDCIGYTTSNSVLFVYINWGVRGRNDPAVLRIAEFQPRLPMTNISLAFGPYVVHSPNTALIVLKSNFSHSGRPKAAFAKKYLSGHHRSEFCE